MFNKIKNFFLSGAKKTGRAVGTVVESVADVAKELKKKTFAFFAKYVYSGFGGRREFVEECPIDLNLVRKAYYSDSYVKQSIDKHVDLLFKAGYFFDGKDQRTIQYIKRRFVLMEDATNTPLDVFLSKVGKNLIHYSNVFILKVREKYGKTPISIRISGVGGKEPIAGYRVLNPASMRIIRDEYGNIKKYRQVPLEKHPMINYKKQHIDFEPEDIIHIYACQEDGFAFGVPFITPALQDVELLRTIEENVARLIYRMTFPFMQIKIGLPKEGHEAHEEEIETYERKINEMPIDGIFVTNERVEANVKGVEGEALRVEEYLRYFEERAFTGLAVSPIQLGRGDTANRSTADALALEMQDRVKAFQKLFSVCFNFFIIRELLLEGGYNFYANEGIDVKLRFDEIDLETKIKMENHVVYKYEHNSISEGEMRIKLGEEPVTKEQRKEMFVNTVSIPRALAGKAINSDSGGSADGDNKNKPANQHGTRLSPKIRKSESREHDALVIDIDILTSNLREKYDSLIADIGRIFDGKDNKKQINLLSHLTGFVLKSYISKYVSKALMGGILSGCTTCGLENYATTIFSALNRDVEDYNIEYVDRMIKSTIDKCAEIERSDGKIVEELNRLKIRLSYISDHQIKQAYWYGLARTGEIAEIAPIVIAEKDCCDKCAGHNGKIGQVEIESVPAYHPGCKCIVKLEN